jgi:hypothetical protein
VCLEMTNKLFKRSGTVGNIILIASRNIKSSIETALVSTLISTSL